MGTMRPGATDGSAAGVAEHGRVTSSVNASQYTAFGPALSNTRYSQRRNDAENPRADLSGRNMVAATRSRFGSSLIDRHVAIVDPLLVHPFPPKPFLAGELGGRFCGRKWFAFGRRIRRREDLCEGWLRKKAKQHCEQMHWTLMQTSHG
jgi:hypothetical protein